ncbi:helix-turn-helix domain-containing protein [Actinomadura sp. 21ATH]|uniref:helix-turn-helix domain-containing protein n=1 Tax=Actinomadura sp. 21ATH TaxID=1735444 RepID=UPI0035C208BC
MPQRPNDLRPWESPESLFGSELRHYREAAGLSCTQLSNKIPFAKSTISATERAETRCDRSLAVEADKVLDTRGALTRLWDALFKHLSAIPSWFLDWYKHEPEVINIRSFEPIVVPGLLQTPEYARALLNGDEAKVEARIARQALLSRMSPPPPSLMYVIDESVLYRDIGGHEVMAAQLEYLAAVSSRLVRVQIVPSMNHGGLTGAFFIGTLAGGMELGYRDAEIRGETTADRADVARLSENFSLIQSHAYPQNQSIDLIRKVAKERWT